MVNYAGGYDFRLVAGRRGGQHRNPLLDAMRLLGLSRIASYEKYIPRVYMDACREARLALLQGLLDTDGWVEKWGSVRFCTTSPKLAKDVVELVRSLGGWCSVNQKGASFSYDGQRKRGRDA
jgi:replicative DNA helicase